MAFTKANLTLVGGNASVQLWNYYTADAQATVVASAYFNDMIDDMNVGDIIIVTYLGGGSSGSSELIVTSVTTNVTTTDNVTQT